MKKTMLMLLVAIVLSLVLTFNASARSLKEHSPHGDALVLVLSTQKDVIRKLDNENWWHDVKERSWNVQRPFHPGGIDSRHLFTVLYKIDGKKIAKWSVNTKDKTVKMERR